ncbi:putative potential Queuosine, Q, salvage protein family protein [Lyophyllum shimeji]|uniref:Queuosine 5'-phosphate N-glycosylase/hydrolase n=1 Tax=Lyophyllum shimeji TaxID=47721 RepID=A0A9P3UMS9_LYOSH|nr:putative potential Queuosine, Q, salvage protein family protein [Lyophyllum shimeji]
MSLHALLVSDLPGSGDTLNEKDGLWIDDAEELMNPVIESSEFIFKATGIVRINDDGVKMAAKHIRQKISTESYTPRTWRTHPLHLVPPDPYIATDPINKQILDWIFLISALNFSFWSEKEGRPDRYGVEWRDRWGSDARKVWTGYWSLVASLNRALADDDVPITDPNFYSSETACPDSLIEHVFRPAEQSAETIPLLRQRIAVMREVGSVLCSNFGGSFLGFIEEFHRRNNGEGTALELVQMVTDTFPSFRDEVIHNGRKVYFWKRAQILVAETWAAFFPASPTGTHPIFPGSRGPQIQQLTMFADYRVPQILHHLRILTYPPSLVKLLQAGAPLESGSKEEMSLRAASILAVERVREEILRLFAEEKDETGKESVSSVLIDFYLWDLAKKIESGEEKIEGMETADMAPIHRTRSIWY